MSDKYVEEFTQHWKDTENVLDYNIKSLINKGKVITSKYIDNLIDTEVKKKRWFSVEIIHPSKVWLDKYTLSHPEEGNKIKNIIQGMKINAGIRIIGLLLNMLPGLVILFLSIFLIFKTGLLLSVGLCVVSITLIVLPLIYAFLKNRNIPAAISLQMKEIQKKCIFIINSRI